MKILTDDGTELMTVDSVEATEKGILIRGTIMGAMPMKGVLSGKELRAGRKFISWKLVWTVLAMLFGRK